MKNGHIRPELKRDNLRLEPASTTLSKFTFTLDTDTGIITCDQNGRRPVIEEDNEEWLHDYSGEIVRVRLLKSGRSPFPTKYVWVANKWEKD
jgi:hypothetical protein